MAGAVQPPLTPAAFHVLLAIAAGRNHGYSVMRYVEDVSAGAVRLGPGTLYGSAVWLGADEVALPALGYAAPAQERPTNEHIYGAAAHAVYGAVTETVRDVLRCWLD